MELAKITDSPEVWYIITHNNPERQPFLAGPHYLTVGTVAYRVY
jgi:hypothetical protein